VPIALGKSLHFLLGRMLALATAFLYLSQWLYIVIILYFYLRVCSFWNKFVDWLTEDPLIANGFQSGQLWAMLSALVHVKLSDFRSANPVFSCVIRWDPVSLLPILLRDAGRVLLSWSLSSIYVVCLERCAIARTVDCLVFACVQIGEPFCFVQSPVNDIANTNSIGNFIPVLLRIFR